MNGPGASTLLTASLFALVATVAQIGDYTSPILTGSDKSMQQYESFRAHVERDGHHELVVLGNSIARQSVNMRQLQRELEPALGRRLVAYNFAAGGTPSAALDLLVELAYGVDDPEIFLIVLTARMVAAPGTQADERARALLMHTSPYGVALRDPVRWRGGLQRWLLDHVALARLRYALRAAALGEPSRTLERGGYDQELGYKKTKEHTVDAEAWGRVDARMRGPLLVSEESQRVLAELVRDIRAHGADVWLVEGALHPRRFAALPDPERDLAAARAAIRRVAEDTGARALLLPAKLAFPESDFGDVSHLDAGGAAKYTSWLAASLAPSLRSAR